MPEEVLHISQRPTSRRKERTWLGFVEQSSADGVDGAARNDVTNESSRSKRGGEHRGKSEQWLPWEENAVQTDDGRDAAQSARKETHDTQPHAEAQAEKPSDAEDGRLANHRYSNLDEIAVPNPVDQEAQRRQSHLEDRSDDTLGEKREQEAAEAHQKFSRFWTEVYTISYLIVFSILGTLARLGLQALTFYPGAPVQTGVLWANVGGSLIMGYLLEDRMLFHEEWGIQPSSSTRSRRRGRRRGSSPNGRSNSLKRTPSNMAKHTAAKKTLPLYIGLATGFCGSFTSFSAFMRDAFFALANTLPQAYNHPSPAPNTHRNGGYSFLALLAVLITTTGLSLGALQLGGHLALGLDAYTPSIPFALSRKLLDRIAVFLAVGLWGGAIIMTALPPDRLGGEVGGRGQQTWRGQALFAVVFAPLGCLLRFYVSLALNGKITRAFPLGTFAVNIFGTGIEALVLDLQRVPVGGSGVGCQVLQGVGDGFCGCLTTVSTWVAEIKGLRRRHGYVYAGFSMGIGLGVMVVVCGSLLWTRGFGKVGCVV